MPEFLEEKTYQKLGKNELANEWFGKASNFLTTYYGQLAFMELNPNQPFELSKDIEVSKEYRDYFFKKELVGDIAFLMKRAGHLLSKMRFVSAQLDAYISNEVWLKNAKHANAMGKKLSQGLLKHKNIGGLANMKFMEN